MTVDFCFYTVEAVSDDSVIVSVFFDDFIEQYPDQTETATDKRNQNRRIHDISPRSELLAEAEQIRFLPNRRNSRFPHNNRETSQNKTFEAMFPRVRAKR